MTSLADLTRGPERVFPTHARVERYYPAAGAEEARSVLRRCIERGEGPALLIGSPGTGKSMLLQVVAHDVAGKRPVACLTSAQLCTRRALLQSILFELDQPFRQCDEGELRLELIDYLKSANVGDRGVVLLVDEAQALPTRLLEELRVLSNLSIQGNPRLHLVLAGSQSLDEKFTSPEIEAFNQRIAARCYLSPFNHHDTVQYVRGHLAAAGANPDELFTSDALNAVYEATGGIARLINQLCDRALLVGTRRQALRVNRDLVQGAWADLQQLPTPWNLPDSPETIDAPSAPSAEYGPLSPGGRDQLSDFDGTELDEIFDALDLGGEHFGFDDPAPHVRSAFPAARVFDPSDDEGDDLALVNDTGELELVAPEVTNPFSEESRFAVEPSVDQRGVTNPFDESFDDEEVVIDPFATLESVVSAGAVPVTNRFEQEISGLLHKVTQYGEQLLDDTSEAVIEQENVECDAPCGASCSESCDDQAKLSTSFTIVEAFESCRGLGRRDRQNGKMEQASTIADRSATQGTIFGVPTRRDVEEHAAAGPTTSGSTPEILVVDDEGLIGENPAVAFPTDYRQLFASLRRD